jgi:putative IMPACT (imprinted ancient) family translation regulator
MKRVLLTTTAIVGLSAPAFAADPTAVSDQPYFHHSHPMTWSGSMSISLTNLAQKDRDDAVAKSQKKDFVFGDLFDTAAVTLAASGEEALVGVLTDNASTNASLASQASDDGAHAVAHINTLTNLTAADFTALEDIVDDYFGGSYSEAYDVMAEVYGNTANSGSDRADLAADLKAFADAQDAGSEAVETTASINTTASLGVSMSAGDGWTASTSGTINLGGGSVSAGSVSLSNGMMTIAVGKSQHAAKAAVATVFGMDRTLNTNSADSSLSATLNLGGATVSVDNELNGDSLETTNQTVGIKGSYGTMSYGLGWEADGDLGFSIGTSLGGVGLTISRVNTGSTYSMGLGANVDLGGGMKLSATNAQNSDGLTDVKFDYDQLSLNAGGTAYAYSTATTSLGDALQSASVHKSISTVGITYAGGGTSLGVTYHEKASTSASGDNLVASGSMALSPTITLTGSYNKNDALTTIGASGPLGSAGTVSAVMSSTGSSKITASFKF